MGVLEEVMDSVWKFPIFRFGDIHDEIKNGDSSHFLFFDGLGSMGVIDWIDNNYGKQECNYLHLQGFVVFVR
jgi:hypothetical protein